MPRRSEAQPRQWCKQRRHLRGHAAYCAITGNAAALSRFRDEVQRCWRKWRSRRSRASRLSWEAFHLMLARYPRPTLRVMHAV